MRFTVSNFANCNFGDFCLGSFQVDANVAHADSSIYSGTLMRLMSRPAGLLGLQRIKRLLAELALGWHATERVLQPIPAKSGLETVRQVALTRLPAGRAPRTARHA